jgi:6-phosphogluconolactonase
MRTLAGGSAPAEVAFSPGGEVLMVTEKSTNLIDTWSVVEDGYASNRVTTASHGGTPFGFTFADADIARAYECVMVEA